MSSIDFSNHDSAARQIADQVKALDYQGVADNLAFAYLSMGKNDTRFQDLLGKIKADNVQDRKANKYLPGFDYNKDFELGEWASITKPGGLLGNALRESDRVFESVSTKDSVGVGADGKPETVVANDGSNVYAYNIVKVIAERGSKVYASDDSKVLAEAGSKVLAEGSPSSLVTAYGGSVVTADADANVVAEKDSKVVAKTHSHVTAKSGALVLADAWAQVDAQKDSTIVDFGDLLIKPEPGANVIAPSEFFRLYGGNK